MTEHINPFQHIRLEHLHGSPTNPRKHFDPEDLRELADTIAQHGVIEPIIVRCWPEDYDWTERDERPLYEIIAGERRYRASLLAGKEDIPALVRAVDTRAVLEIQIIENLQRRGVNELEEATGYDLMMRDFGYTADQLAEKVGKSRAYIYARLKLTALCEAAREAFRAGTLDASRALLIARIPGATLQAKALTDITEGWHGVLNYRAAANHIQNHYMRGLANVVFALDDPYLNPEAGPCTTCAKRPFNTPELYPDVPPDRIADVCTDPDCMHVKTEAHMQRAATAAAARGRTLLRGLTYADINADYKPLDAEDYDQPVRIPVDEDGNDLPPEMAGSADEHRPPTVSEMLQRSGAQIEIVLIEHPRTHELVECVRRADYRAAVPVPDADDDWGAQERARETEARKAEAARRRAIFKAIRARYEDATLTWYSKAAVLRVIARQFFGRSWNNTCATVATLNNIPTDGFGNINGWLAEASASELIPLLLDLALEPTTDLPSYGDITTPAPLLDMARALGIDPDNPNAPPPAAPETASTPPQAAPAGDGTAKKTRKPKPTSPAKKAAPARGSKAEKPNGQAAGAAKKTQEKGKDSGRASAAGEKEGGDPAPYRCPNTPDMLEGASA
jgi:ParB/RepB/Spo0J family partition protein